MAPLQCGRKVRRAFIKRVAWSRHWTEATAEEGSNSLYFPPDDFCMFFSVTTRLRSGWSSSRCIDGICAVVSATKTASATRFYSLRKATYRKPDSFESGHRAQ